MLEMFCDLIIGLLLGLISSILPGVHINTFAQFFAEITSVQSVLISIGVFSVLGVLPSIVFGVPDPDTIGSFFPIQSLMSEGALRKAVILIILASLVSVALSSLVMLLVPNIVVDFYNFIKIFIPVILGLFISYSFFFSGWSNRLVILLSSVFGLIILNINLDNVLLPTFAGLFAIPFLLSLNSSSYPRQVKQKFTFPWQYALLGTFLGLVSAVLPAVSSPGQLAIIASPFLTGPVSFLVLSTSILVSKYIFAVPMKTELFKPRVGAYNFIDFTTIDFIFIVFGVVFACLFLYLIINFLSKFKLTVKNSKYISFILIAYLIFLIFVSQGFVGLLVLLSASLLGIYSQKLKTKKTHLMNVIIFPTFLRYII